MHPTRIKSNIATETDKMYPVWPVPRGYKQDKFRMSQSFHRKFLYLRHWDSSGTQRKGPSAVGNRYQAVTVKMWL
jgi:hypothetical protein